jgi:hypothetical protein
MIGGDIKDWEVVTDECRDRILNIIYYRLEAVDFAKLIGTHYECALEEITSYVDYLLGRVHHAYDMRVITTELRAYYVAARTEEEYL